MTRYEVPVRGTTPGVLRTPTRLQNDTGTRMDPPQSVPSPTVARFAATAAPVPELEPPGSRFGSYGLRVSVVSDEYENQDVAQSGSVVLASTMAPASRNRRVLGRPVAAHCHRPVGGRQVAGVDVVLQHNGDPVQRPRWLLAVELFRTRERLLAAHDDRVQRRARRRRRPRSARDTRGQAPRRKAPAPDTPPESTRSWPPVQRIRYPCPRPYAA